jgi:Fe-S-cluster containining protein
MDYQKYIDAAQENIEESKKLFKKLKKKKKVDALFHDKHDNAFEEIDCLNCGNCCKTTSPIFRDVDIRRLAKRLRMKDSQFIDDFLRIDGDNDYVLKSSPCFFLDEDNSCSVYKDRPNACKEYPHTNRKRMNQLLDLTIKNTEVCPAVAKIVEEIRVGGVFKKNPL